MWDRLTRENKGLGGREKGKGWEEGNRWGKGGGGWILGRVWGVRKRNRMLVARILLIWT